MYNTRGAPTSIENWMKIKKYLPYENQETYQRKNIMDMFDDGYSIDSYRKFAWNTRTWWRWNE